MEVVGGGVGRRTGIVGARHTTGLSQAFFVGLWLVGCGKGDAVSAGEAPAPAPLMAAEIVGEGGGHRHASADMASPHTVEHSHPDASAAQAGADAPWQPAAAAGPADTDGHAHAGSAAGAHAHTDAFAGQTAAGSHALPDTGGAQAGADGHAHANAAMAQAGADGHAHAIVAMAQAGADGHAHADASGAQAGADGLAHTDASGAQAGADGHAHLGADASQAGGEALAAAAGSQAGADAQEPSSGVIAQAGANAHEHPDAGVPLMDGGNHEHWDAAVPQPDAASHAHQDATVPQPDAASHEHLDGAAPHPDAASHEHPDASTPPEPELRCHHTYRMDPRDAALDSTPRIVTVGFSSRDVLLPQAVVDWLDELGLETAHNDWHSERRWDSVCGVSFASASDCAFAQQLVAAGRQRAEAQQGAPGSGLAFLAMHRHMLHQLRAAFPTHPELATGFSHLPRTRADAENPTPWKTLRWSSDNVIGFEVLENIEQHLDQFPDEDALGLYMESNLRWSPFNPTLSTRDPGAGVHSALHNQWAVNRSPGNLGRTDTALRNATFWRLHAFLDDVWSRYRAARGLSDGDRDYLRALDDECVRMHELAPHD